MSKPLLNYYLIRRKDPNTQDPQYYAQKVQYTNIDNETLLNRIVANTSVPKGVIRAAVDAIRDSIINFVMNGHSVELGGLMSLRPTVRCRLSGFGSATHPTAVPENTFVRLRAYWGNDVRNYQFPSNYNFEKVEKS